MGPNRVLLVNLWGGHCPTAVQEATRPNKNVHLNIIPTGTTTKRHLCLVIHRIRMFEVKLLLFVSKLMIIKVVMIRR